MLASLVSLTIDYLTSSYLLLVLVLVSIPTLYFLFFMSSPPHAPPTFHFLAPALSGRFHLKRRGPLDLIQAGYAQLGDCFRLQLLHKHLTVMIGPEANQLVFEAVDTVLSQQEVYSFTVPVFGKNIVYDAPRPVMQQQLKFTAKGLNTQHMQRHAERIVSEAEAFFDSWPQQGEVDLLHEFSRLIILTASRCLLGEEIRNSVHERFASLYQTLSDGMSHISFFWPYAPTEAHRRRDAAREEIRKIFAPVIAARRLELQSDAAAEHDDFLQVLIESRYTDGSAATDEEIGGMLLAALFGGQHTSNITATWLGFNILMQKQSLMRRLIDEQRETVGQDDHPTFTSLGEMQLLHASMKETLRLYPPLIALMRTALEPIQYRQFIIPKGDIVVVVPPVSHQLSTVYSNPQQFDPDRFLLRNEDKVKYSFISFGGGRHGCLGQQFAFLQVKTIWSTLLRRFDFELMPDGRGELPLVDYSNIVAGPTPPCKVRFKRKTDPYSMSSF